MVEGVRNDASYVGLRRLYCIYFAGEFQPLVCQSLMVFCTSSRLSNFLSHQPQHIAFRECTHAQLLRPCISPSKVSQPYLHPPFCPLSLPPWHSLPYPPRTRHLTPANPPSSSPRWSPTGALVQMHPCRYSSFWRRLHTPHTHPTLASRLYHIYLLKGKLKRVPGLTCSGKLSLRCSGAVAPAVDSSMTPQTTHTRCPAGGGALHCLLHTSYYSSNIQVDLAL
jgi:hypothetical protein